MNSIFYQYFSYNTFFKSIKNYLGKFQKLILSFMFHTEELIFKLEEDISLSHGEKKVRKFERAPRPNRLSTHVNYIY